jgi:lipopolysaccharide/colanic/teichoic acid biosynthesis glycosyltransferase
MYPGKRLFDVTFSVLGVLVFSPVWIVVIGLIALLDGRPIFFTQHRLGLHKREFTIYKFRTMTTEGAVTRTGRWLRATGIDESTQFLCVLKGDMSIVGPRPFRATDLVKLGWESPRLKYRWEVKPGITGLAQIHERWATSRSLAWDRLYIRWENMAIDLKIITVTFLMNIFGKVRVRGRFRGEQAY